MVTNVTSLLKTVKAVEDEATRGTRALEATIEYVKQELTVRSSSLLLGFSRGDAASLVERLRRGQRYLRLLFPRKQGSLFFPLSLPSLLSVWLISSPLPHSPCRVLTALSKVWREDAGGGRKARGPLQLAFCNLMLILRQPLRWRGGGRLGDGGVAEGFTQGCSHSHISNVYTSHLNSLLIALFQLAVLYIINI